jgi:hypothetical protein
MRLKSRDLRRLLVIAHGDEGAMSQMAGIRPFDDHRPASA